MSISPDGSQLVYVANEQLYLRNLDQMESRPIQGTEGGPRNPFFSPDGRWVAFQSSVDQQLKKIAISGGVPVTLCDATWLFGASWGEGDTIVFGQLEGIKRVSGNGASCELLIATEPGELVHGPEILPDGKSILFTLASGTGSDRWDEAQIVVQSLESESEERTVVVEGGSDARYVPTGHLVYVLEDVLFAVPFDLTTLEVSGEAVSVVQGTARTPAPGFRSGTEHFSFSADSGDLAYIPAAGVAAARLLQKLFWFDTDGKAVPALEAERESYLWAEVSPDGDRVVAATTETGAINIWIYDLATGTPTQLTDDDQFKSNPIWTPDGERVTFRRGSNIYSQLVDGSAPADLLWESDQPAVPIEWSPDGQFLAFNRSDPETLSDIWIYSVQDATAEPFLDTALREIGGRFSPDGEWISYTRFEGDELQVLVAPFPGPGLARQAHTSSSRFGGGWNKWSPDGKQLYIRGAGPDGVTMMAVQVETEPDFRRVETRSLFSVHGGLFVVSDIHPDGDRLLIATSEAIASGQGLVSQQINVVLNFFEELKERVPVP